MTPELLEEIEAEMPAPTYWPAILAVSITAACFGFLTVGIFFYIGGAACFVAVGGWMYDLLKQGPAARAHDPSHVGPPRPVRTGQAVESGLTDSPSEIRGGGASGGAR